MSLPTRLLASVAFGAALIFPASAQLASPSAGITQTASPDAVPIEGVAAIVNDTLITYSDVRERARLNLLSLGAGQPTQEQINQIASQSLTQLIDEKLQMEKAAEFEIEVGDDQVARRVDGLARQNGLTRDEFYQQLRSAGVRPETLEAQTRAEIAWQIVMQGLYGSRIRVSPTQISERLDRMRSASGEEQYQLAEIFLFAPTPELKTEARQAADSLVQQLNEGAPFQLAAQRFSSSSTAATGGDMGWNKLADIKPELADAVSGMEQPGIIGPIEVDNGFYVLALRNKREPTGTTTKVELKRLLTREADDAPLLQAVEAIDGCDEVDPYAGQSAVLTSASLGEIAIDELGPEGQQLVTTTPVGEATPIFATSGGLAVMYVCDRKENVENMPGRDAVEDQLFQSELGMIAQRTLRDLRRDATIIQRN